MTLKDSSHSRGEPAPSEIYTIFPAIMTPALLFINSCVLAAGNGQFMCLRRATVEHFPTVNVTFLIQSTCERTRSHTCTFLYFFPSGSFFFLPFFSFVHCPGANWIFSRAVCNASKFCRATECKMSADIGVLKEKIKREVSKGNESPVVYFSFPL